MIKDKIMKGLPFLSESLFRTIDEENKGQISFLNFLLFYLKLINENPNLIAFSIYDLNKDHKITCHEIELIENSGEGNNLLINKEFQLSFLQDLKRSYCMILLM